ncbi:BnaA04g25540D [Brassica napus]|uniref:BnaA04g25540D protein n=2 Tax=Brassica napus TaxID=3708 RepID=A0A078H0V3_BRANA|nr:BnaA04g25540D [Brassica napus]
MSAIVALCRARASSSYSLFNSVVRPAFRSFSTGFADAQNKTLVAEMKEKMLHMDMNSMIGSSMPLGTNAKILKEPSSGKCLIKLPSGDTRWINSSCRATIGEVSNPSHGVKKKLRKAGERKSKSSGSRGRTSVTPWGKPCKGGYKSASVKKKKKRLAAREAKMM